MILWAAGQEVVSSNPGTTKAANVGSFILNFSVTLYPVSILSYFDDGIIMYLIPSQPEGLQVDSTHWKRFTSHKYANRSELGIWVFQLASVSGHEILGFNWNVTDQTWMNQGLKWCIQTSGALFILKHYIVVETLKTIKSGSIKKKKKGSTETLC